MKKSRAIKPKRPEFEGKSQDYQDGYKMAEEYFDHILESGNRLGSTPFRIFVEAVAESMRNRERIGSRRVALLECILMYSDSEFNRGVHDLLVKRVKEYNANEVITIITGVGKNAVPEMQKI